MIQLVDTAPGSPLEEGDQMELVAAGLRMLFRIVLQPTPRCVLESSYHIEDQCFTPCPPEMVEDFENLITNQMIKMLGIDEN